MLLGKNSDKPSFRVHPKVAMLKTLSPNYVLNFKVDRQATRITLLKSLNLNHNGWKLNSFIYYRQITEKYFFRFQVFKQFIFLKILKTSSMRLKILIIFISALLANLFTEVNSSGGTTTSYSQLLQ